MKNLTEKITIQEFRGTRVMKMKLTSTKSRNEQYTQHASSGKQEKRAVMKKQGVQMKEKQTK